MTVFIRGQLETYIENLEPGKFQEFTSKFLHIFDPKYKGLVRLGATPFGKTRAGTPDFLLTLADGQEIGCECGTGEDFWIPPEKQSEYESKWKPISDAIKCIEILINPKEIIIASSRPIPSNHPNVKSKILQLLSEKYIQKIFKLISLEDFANWIEQNLHKDEVFLLLKEFFPEIAKYLEGEKRINELTEIINYSSNFGIDTKIILDILDFNKSNISDKSKMDEILKNAFFEEGKYTITKPNFFKGIKRFDESLNILSNPFSKVIQIIGIPKIGKNTLVSEAIIKNNFNYLWFSVPFQVNCFQNFIDVFSISVLSYFFKSEYVFKSVKLGNLNLIPEMDVPKGIAKKIFIIDEAHTLNDASLKSLNSLFTFLRKRNLLGYISIILLTNKNIKSLIRFEESCSAPTWTTQQLKDLIGSQNICIYHENGNYFEDLKIHSNGHPLCAIYLAKKYPKRSDLIINKIINPGIDEIDLTEEVKHNLYHEILLEPDSQNFIQRLALLIGRADEKVLDVIRMDISPNITKSSINLIEEIGPSVIEGNIKDGVRVSSTFSEIAKKKISAREREEVYREVSKSLLTIKDNTIQVDKYLDGIFYTILSDNLGKAISSAIYLLLITTKRNDASVENIKYILDRLDILNIIKKPLKGFELFSRYALMLMISNQYFILGDTKKGFQLLEKIELKSIDSIQNEDNFNLKKGKESLILGILGTKLINIRFSKNINQIIYDFLNIPFKLTQDISFLDLVNSFPHLLFQIEKELLKTIDFNFLIDKLFTKHLDQLIRIAYFTGCRLKDDTIFNNNILELKSLSQNQEIFYGTILISAYLNNGQTEKSIHFLRKVDKILKDLNINPNKLGADYFQLKGEITFNKKHYPRALDFYKKSNLLDNEKKSQSFTFAWNNYKSGFCSQDPNESIQFFQKSIKFFEKSNNKTEYSRALGAISAIHIQNKNFEEGLIFAKNLADLFHKKKFNESGPPLRLLMSQMMRIIHEVKGNRILENLNNYPLIDKLHFYTMGEIAPEAGGVVTYNILSEFSEISKLPEMEINFLKESLSFEITKELERDTLNFNYDKFWERVDISKVNWDEISKILKNFLKNQPLPNTPKEGFFFLSIFRQFTKNVKNNSVEWYSGLEKYLEIIKSILPQVSYSISSRWEAHIKFHQGLLYHFSGNREKAVQFFTEALNCAEKDNFCGIVSECCFYLTFNYTDLLPSIEKIGEIQIRYLNSLKKSNASDSFYINLGINTHRLWKKVQWNRLTSKDLKTKNILLDTSKELDVNFLQEEEVAKIMINLLFILNSEEPKYKVILDPVKYPKTYKLLNS